MKINSYRCDVCGKDIKPHARQISSPDGNCILASYPSKDIYHVLLQEKDCDSQQVIHQKAIDICDVCESKIITLLHDIKTNSPKDPKNYIPKENYLENLDVFNEI